MVGGEVVSIPSPPSGRHRGKLIRKGGGDVVNERMSDLASERTSERMNEWNDLDISAISLYVCLLYFYWCQSSQGMMSAWTG